MRVLMITGDRNFGPGNARYELQRAAVDGLAVVFMGRGNAWPAIPAGHFDVVTAQDPFWRGLFAWRAARRLGAGLNIQVHADLAGQSWMRRSVAAMILRRADSVRVVSEKIKKQVENMGARARITVLPVFVDVSRFQNVVRQPGSQKTVIWIGRFENEKDPLRAVAVFREVRTSIPDAKLVMLGKGALEPRLRAAAKDLPVEFPGWQDPLPYFARADVVLCTSRFESYGAGMVEALAAEVPVVAPDVGVAREAGAVVAPREDLAQTVVRVLQAGQRGELKLPVLSAKAWAQAWRESL